MAESSRRTDAPLSRAIELARDALAAVPAGILTDFDGTLSPIVPDPADARPVPGAVAALESLADRLAVVAIITGRAAIDARELIGVPALWVVGNHGTEWLEPHALQPSPSPYAAALRTALDAILERLPSIDGTAVEHKGLSATVHYRRTADPTAARAAIRSALGDTSAIGIEQRDGRMSVELRPMGAGDKGTAARALIADHGLRGVVVLGDDVTDLDLFGAAHALRGTGVVTGAIFGVGAEEGEVPAAVGAAADLVLDGPGMAAALLVALAED